MSNKRSKFLEYFLLSALLCFLVIGLGKFGALNIPISILSEVFTPIRLVSSSVIAESQKESLKKVAASVKQQKIDAEMRALRDQFAISNPRSSSLLLAKVIGMPSFIPGVSSPEYLILDRGDEDGIKKGQAVVLFENLIGKIDQVGQSSSRVILVISRDVSFTGKLESGAIGVVTGAGDTVEIANILSSEDVEKDTQVRTRGDQDLEESGIPPDLVVGKIASIEKNPSALFQKAQIKSFVNFTKLNMVFVVVK